MSNRAREWANEHNTERKLEANGWGTWCDVGDVSREENQTGSIPQRKRVTSRFGCKLSCSCREERLRHVLS